MGRPEARRMIRSAASSASVPVVRNTTRSVRFGQTDEQLLGRSDALDTVPRARPARDTMLLMVAFTTSTISGWQCR